MDWVQVHVVDDEFSCSFGIDWNPVFIFVCHGNSNTVEKHGGCIGDKPINQGCLVRSDKKI